MVLLEQKIQLEGNFTARRLGFEGVIANVSNGIWCFYDDDIKLEVICDHEQSLTVSASSWLLERSIVLTFVYTKCTKIERRDLWHIMRSLDPSIPWLVGGDFNIIQHPHERKGGGTPKLRAMEEFNQCISDCGLIDAGYERSEFTWTNNRLWQRLDRVLYSQAWMDTFTNIRVQHISRACSDHHALLVSVSLANVRRPSSFWFFNMWTKHHDFLNVVKNNSQYACEGKGMVKLHHKLYRKQSSSGGIRMFLAMSSIG